LSEDGVHEVVWTDALLAEWEEVIVRAEKRSAEAAAAITAAIREFFGDGKVERSEYAPRRWDAWIGRRWPRAHGRRGRRRPCTILTRNWRDFPAEPLATRGVRVADPDTYLCALLDELADVVIGTVVRLAGEKRRPPKTPDLLDDLGHAGVPRFAERAGRLLAAPGGY
jgi:hypothetical protein